MKPYVSCKCDTQNMIETAEEFIRLRQSNNMEEQPDENVRYALMCNTKLTLNKKQTITKDDSPWLTKQFAGIVKNANR